MPITCKDIEKDWTIFMFYNKNGKLVGLNFHYGVDEIDKQYRTPNKALFTYYCCYHYFFSGKIDDYEIVTKAIEYYIKKHIDL